MLQWYARRLTRWENRLANKSTNRVVRPFEWGIEWASGWPISRHLPLNGHGPEAYLRELNTLAMQHSGEFYGYRSPDDFSLAGDTVQFPSPVHTPYPENNLVRARWFAPHPKHA